MTKEEAIKELEEMIKYEWGTYQTKTARKYVNALKMAIKALEQEPIFDKIKAEIEEEYGGYDICEWYEDYDFEDNDISEYERVGSVSDIMKIIDRYKTESEV